tara:strand:+ start:1599 stop:2270 length:672 start_codon:yes stop_codon:yes gene_type:complete
MTLAEIRDRVYLLLDKAGAPYFTVDELNEFIDMAQMEFVKTRYKEFELTEKRFQDLVPLVRRLTIATADITNDLIIISGANSVSVDDDILYVLQLHSDYVIHCGDTTETKTLSVPQLDWDNFGKIQSDPFNRTSESNPKYVMFNEGPQFGVNSTEAIELHPNSGNDYILVYLRRPTDATTNPAEIDLPEHTHDEIVNLAVRKLLFNIESPSYQVQDKEINNME